MMPRLPKRIVLIIGAVVGLLVVVAMTVCLLVDVNRYKPRLEVAASNAMGMEVRFGGRLGVGFFPGFHVTVEDGHILSEQGADIVSVKRASLWIDVLPLLRREFRLRRIELGRNGDSFKRLYREQLVDLAQLLTRGIVMHPDI